MSAEDHLQREEMLYEKFWAQIEAVLASQPQLLKKEEKPPDEKVKRWRFEGNSKSCWKSKGLAFQRH